MGLKIFIKPEFLILIPTLYVVGIGLMSATWVIATSDIFTLKDIAYALFISVIQDILSAGTSVYVSQLYIQLKKKD